MEWNIKNWNPKEDYFKLIRLFIKQSFKTVGSPGELLEAVEKKFSALDYRLRAQGMAKIFTDPNSVEIMRRAASLPETHKSMLSLAARLLTLTLPESQQAK